MAAAVDVDTSLITLILFGRTGLNISEIKIVISFEIQNLLNYLESLSYILTQLT